MDQNELREYFRQKKQLSMQDSDTLNNTITECKRIIRTEKSRMNYHMSFMEFLTDTFHRDGASLILVQIVVLLGTCLIIHELRDIPNLLPLFIPLFVLAALPTLFKAERYRMSELEAVTLNSNITLFLARLIIILLTDLFSFTLLLIMESIHMNSVRNLFDLIVYVLVPYTFCIGILLFFVRKKGSIGYKNCIITLTLCCIFLGTTAIFFPIIYNVSSIGLWIFFLTVFCFFIIKEIKTLMAYLKEGQIYGVIS